MKHSPVLALALLIASLGAVRAQTPALPANAPALTIYNQNFAVVRQAVPLDLKVGLNHVTVNDITVHVEPDSVILRDPAGKRTLQIRSRIIAQTRCRKT